MNGLGNRIAKKRKDLGVTQTEFAEDLCVTRQTVSRWESGSVLPDIEKITDIADRLGVSCDYLLKGEGEEETAAPRSTGISALLKNIEGRKVRLNFFEDEADIDLFNSVCEITAFEGNWMKVKTETKKGIIEKLIPVSSVLSFELMEEEL